MPPLRSCLHEPSSDAGFDRAILSEQLSSARTARTARHSPSVAVVESLAWAALPGTPGPPSLERDWPVTRFRLRRRQLSAPHGRARLARDGYGSVAARCAVGSR